MYIDGGATWGIRRRNFMSRKQKAATRLVCDTLICIVKLPLASLGEGAGEADRPRVTPSRGVTLE